MEQLFGNSPSKKETLPYMTIFEKANVIKKRAEQLDNGYKSNIENIVKKEGLTKSDEIAEREFILGKLPPYEIRREWGDGSFEIWTHKDFNPRLEDIPEEELFLNDFPSSYTKNEKKKDKKEKK